MPTRHAAARAAWIGAFGVLALAGCSSTRVPVGAPATGSPAPAPPLVSAWKANVEAAGGPRAILATSTHALVATRKGTLAVVSLDRGKVTARPSFGSSLDAAPLRTDAALWLPVEKGRHGLLRLDAATGDVTHRLLGRTGVRTTPVALGDVVVAATTQGDLVGLDATTGATRWTVALGDRSLASAPLQTPEGVVAASAQGRVVAVDAAGAVRWEVAGTPVEAAPALAGTVVVVPGTRGRLAGLDAATGRGLWTLALADTTVRFGDVTTVAPERVLVGATDRRLRLVDTRAGREVWSVDAGAVVLAGALPAGDGLDAVAYVGTHGRRLLAVRLSDGEVVWEGRTEGRVKTAPVSAGGCVLVFAEPRHVHCFRPAAHESRN